MTNSADPDQKPTDLDLHYLQRQGTHSVKENCFHYLAYIVEASEVTASSRHIKVDKCLTDCCQDLALEKIIIP